MIKIIKRLLLIFLLPPLLCTCTVEAEKPYANYSENSNFKLTDQSDNVSADNLVLLGKVWGFVKYHHPVFEKNRYNIDYELFELLPQVNSVSRQECQTILTEWIRGLGAFRQNERKYQKEIEKNDYILLANLEWIDNPAFVGEELGELLKDLRYAKRKKENKCLSFVPWTGQAWFEQESDSGFYSSADTGYNLLTLFRLWNMAEYYFPYVDITDKPWDAVLEEYVHKFVSTQKVFETTAELVTELNDSHSVMNRYPSALAYKLPMDVKFFGHKLIVLKTAPAVFAGTEAELLPGDEIIAIDDKLPVDFIERSLKYMSASNYSIVLRNAAGLAVQSSKKESIVKINRDGEQKHIRLETVNREDYRKIQESWESQISYHLLNDSTGYLYAGKYKDKDAAEILAKFESTEALIIDMRCYPSGFMPFGFIGKYLVPNKINFNKFTVPVPTLPGYYGVSTTALGSKNSDYYKGLIVVLVNEQTQSSAEYQTMAFQVCPRVVVVGSQTAGADGNISRIQLPRKIKTIFSGIGVFYPDGTPTQRSGIRIDHYIEPTIEGIREGRDEVLDRAMEIIQSQHLNKQ